MFCCFFDARAKKCFAGILRTRGRHMGMAWARAISRARNRSIITTFCNFGGQIFVRWWDWEEDSRSWRTSHRGSVWQWKSRIFWLYYQPFWLLKSKLVPSATRRKQNFVCCHEKNRCVFCFNLHHVVFSSSHFILGSQNLFLKTTAGITMFLHSSTPPECAISTTPR